MNPSVQNGTFPAKFNNETVYNTYIPTDIPIYFDIKDSNSVEYSMQNQVNVTGFTNLVSPLFSKGVR